MPHVAHKNLTRGIFFFKKLKKIKRIKKIKKKQKKTINEHVTRR